jgi:hypothetical protein
MDFGARWRKVFRQTLLGLGIGAAAALALGTAAALGAAYSDKGVPQKDLNLFFGPLVGLVILPPILMGGLALVEGFWPLLKAQFLCVRMNGDAIEQVLFKRFVLRKQPVSRFTRVEEHCGPPRLVFQGGQIIPLKGLPPEVQTDLTVRLRSMHDAKLAACCRPARPVVVDPAWLSWEGGIVRQLAEAIADVEPSDRMGILADALEDAGCTDEALLSHLRFGGCHADDCWALKLLLARPSEPPADPL